jgi:hypothetical protein
MGSLAWLGYLSHTQVVESSNLSPSTYFDILMRRTRRSYDVYTCHLLALTKVTKIPATTIQNLGFFIAFTASSSNLTQISSSISSPASSPNKRRKPIANFSIESLSLFRSYSPVHSRSVIIERFIRSPKMSNDSSKACLIKLSWFVINQIHPLYKLKTRLQDRSTDNDSLNNHSENHAHNFCICSADSRQLD